MKRTTLTLALALITAALGEGVTADSPSRLAVLRAYNQAASPWWEESGAERAQSLLIARLAESYGYDVMTRGELAERLAAMRRPLIGELSPAGAIRLGRELDVRYLLTGTLVEFGTGARGSAERPGKRPGRRRERKLLGLGGPKDFKVEIVLRLIDTETGKAIWSDSRRAVTELRDVLASQSEESPIVEEVVFEGTLAPLLEELVAQIPAAPSGHAAEGAEPAEESPPALQG